MRIRSVLLLLLIVTWTGACFLSSPALGQRYDLPARPSQPVLDRAGLLTPSEERRLVQKLTRFTDTTSTAIVVVTVPTLNGAPISDYAITLGREWGVGQEDKDNGVVLLISKGDRQVFIATGYGVEGALPDAVANRIVEQVITPAFRNGQFFQGINGGTDAIIQATKGEFSADSTGHPSSDDGFPFALLFTLLILVYFVGGSFFRGGGGRRRKSRRRHGDAPIIVWGGGRSRGGGFSGGGGFGGFGGGSFGGGGAGGSW